MIPLLSALAGEGDVTTTDGIALSWTLERAGDHLVAAYRVENRRDAPVWLLDRLLYRPPGGGVALDAERVTVRPTSGALRLVKGYAPPLGLPQSELLPAARELAPGATAEGRARLPLPLRAWSPNDAERPIEPAPASAVLELGVLLAAPGDERTLPDGTELHVPLLVEAKGQLLVKGEALPLPD